MENSNSQPKPKITPEQAEALLRKAAKDPGPWTLGHIIVTVILIALPVAFLVWFFWPRPDPPELLLVAFDQLVVSGENPDLQASLHHLPDTEVKGRLGNWPIHFQEGMGRLEKPNWHLKTQSTAEGGATVTLEKSLEMPRTSLLVRYVPGQDHRGSQNNASLFRWAPETPILLVDVETTLTPADLSVWKEFSVRDIARDKEASAVLHSLVEKKIAPVYLAGFLDHPLLYRKARDWIKDRPSVKQLPFPDGPVLGRLNYQDTSHPLESVKELVETLQGKFTGPRFAITKNPELARVYEAGQFRTFFLGKKKSRLDGVTVVSSWGELVREFSIDE